MAAPMESSSRLSTCPCTPPSNSSISAAMALERPWMRAMPSPTSSTVPTSETSSWLRYSSICLRMTEAISSDLIFIAAAPHHGVAEALQPAAQRAVVDRVPDAEHEPAQQLGLHLRLQDALPLQSRLQERDELLGALCRQGLGGRRLHAGAPGLLVGQVAVGGGDPSECPDPSLVDQETEEVHQQALHAPAEGLLERLLLHLWLQHRRLQEVRHLGMAGHEGGELGELGADGLDLLPLAGEGEQGLGVDPRHRLHVHARSSRFRNAAPRAIPPAPAPAAGGDPCRPGSAAGSSPPARSTGASLPPRAPSSLARRRDPPRAVPAAPTPPLPSWPCRGSPGAAAAPPSCPPRGSAVLPPSPPAAGRGSGPAGLRPLPVPSRLERWPRGCVAPVLPGRRSEASRR